MILETELLYLVNEYLDESSDIYLETYQRVEFYVYDQDIIKAILSECKFKDVGNAYDYADKITQPTDVGLVQLANNYDMIERIAISKKYNAVMNYNADSYYIKCVILIDIDSIKKFSKKIKKILNKDSGANIFRDTEFVSEKGKYLEVVNSAEDKTKAIDVLTHDITKETLVFDPESVINQVMNDINTFFKAETLELYKKLEIPYKRGIILYGDPGNGKSAMIREIIRNLPNVTKIIINSSLYNVTGVIASLVKALKGKKAIIIIEDMDSVINEENRSEFLNILDGINVISGVYFIGTTNYPDRIDPAFMNRSGRFDRTYQIDNPGEIMRKLFFESRKLNKLFSNYRIPMDTNKSKDDIDIVELFVNNSEGLPMANLKELITSTSYILATDPDISVEEALTNTYKNIVSTRSEHVESYNNAENERRDMYDRNNRGRNSGRMVPMR